MASNQVQKTETTSKKNLRQPQNGAQVTVSNQTTQAMTFNRSFEWYGNVVSPGFPPTIQANSSGLFTHVSNVNFGSEAAVIYSGFNLSMQPCAWVLAWLSPSSSTQSPNKVYVVCGSQGLIDAMNDEQIRMALENSSAASNASDATSKTAANATINDQVPFMANVEADFGLLP